MDVQRVRASDMEKEQPGETWWEARVWTTCGSIGLDKTIYPTTFAVLMPIPTHYQATRGLQSSSQGCFRVVIKCETRTPPICTPLVCMPSLLGDIKSRSGPVSRQSCLVSIIIDPSYRIALCSGPRSSPLVASNVFGDFLRGQAAAYTLYGTTGAAALQGYQSGRPSHTIGTRGYTHLAQAATTEGHRHWFLGLL